MSAKIDRFGEANAIGSFPPGLLMVPCWIRQEVYFLLEDLPGCYPDTGGWYISPEPVTEVSSRGFSVDEPSFGWPLTFYSYEEIGKTVFLTREEAETALKAVSKLDTGGKGNEE